MSSPHASGDRESREDRSNQDAESTAMQLRPWAELVTREVRERLPDVRAVRTGKTVTWMRGSSIARLSPAGPNLWELTVSTTRGVACRTYPERIDVDTAHVAASNIVAHFDPRWCRGIDVAPYPDSLMRA
jgi:hypothetical protein